MYLSLFRAGGLNRKNNHQTVDKLTMTTLRFFLSFFFSGKLDACRLSLLFVTGSNRGGGSEEEIK